SYGQLGIGQHSLMRLTPIQTRNLTDVSRAACGNDHSLAVKTDGTVWAWGENLTGQLGDGTTLRRSTPVQVSGQSGVAAEAGGGWVRSPQSGSQIRWLGLGLGSQLLRATRRRDNRGPGNSGAGQRPDGGRGGGRRRLPQPGAQVEWHGLGLGRKLLWTDRRRN